MGYNIQFIFDESPTPSWNQLQAQLESIQLESIRGEYRLVDDPEAAPGSDASVQQAAGFDCGEIHAGNQVIGYAELESNLDPGTHADVQALLEELDALEEDDESIDTEPASAYLWNACAILKVQVLWQGEDHAESLKKLGPIWTALLGQYSGTLRADHEGYYDRTGLIVDLGA